jgi:hypothetical protein
VFTLDSSHILTVGHRLYNTGGKEHTFQVSIVHFSQFGETSIALPLAAGVVVDMMPSFPDLFDEESHKPETLSETWMCLDGDGFALGVIWQDPKEQEIDGWVRPSLKLNLPVLPPYGRAEAAPLYIYAGPGNWRAVRAIWRRLVKPDAPAHVEPRRAIEAATVPSPLVVLDGKSDTLLRVDNQRTRALAGNVTVSAPDGWSIAPAEGEFTSVRRGKPFDLAIAVRRGRGKGPGAAEGSVTVRHDLAEERFPLPLVALGRRAGVDLTEYQEQGQRLVKIDNGFMRLAVAPDFLGSVVSLEHNGVNHLFSSFPTARAFSWMTPWHGGVSAVLHALDDEDIGPGNPGRMWLESWGYQLVRPRRGAAIPWTGVRLVSDLTRDKLRGLRLEMDYLTVGQSNLLAVVARLVNVTAAPFSGMLVTQAYVQPGGEREKVELYDVERRRIRRMRDQIWGASSGQWAAVAHSASGLCLALVGGKGSGQVSALDFGLDGAHLYDIAVPTLKPHATYEMVSYLVLTPDVEQARLYRWLERWEWAGM